ncbi:MAG: hypothetical protein Q8L51_03770 [Candidatus Amesbacteria bacterium]|nr:hypothetical protein [Candidatus Amesbacteria bacterium]
MSRLKILLVLVVIAIPIITPVLFRGNSYSPQVQGTSTVSSWWQAFLDRMRGNSGWKTFSSKQYGYSLKYPSNWQVQENNTKDTREILVSAKDKSALVKINAYHDPSMTTTDKVTKAIAEMKNKMKTDKNLRVTAFKDSLEGQVGGYIAQGYQKFDTEEWRFENRGLLATNDRVLIMHGAVKPSSPATQWKIIYEIMESFALEQ